MKKTNTFITILALLIIIAAVNFLVARHPVRIDLTQNRIYTLSDATEKILKGLDDIVTIRVYFTKNMPPALEPLRRSVDDILSEFKSYAGKKLQIEYIDPGSSAMEEQKAAMIGIPPLQFNVYEHDKAEVAKVYLGMSVLFGDKQQVLPVVKQTDNLEYDLAEAILKVSSKELPRIAWWESGRAPSFEGSGFSLIREAISRRYEVADVTAKNISNLDSKNFAALVLASPRNLKDDEVFALDQYLMSGGHVIALIDRFDISPSLAINSVETNAVDMLINYGVTIENELVLDRSNAMAAFAGGAVTYHMPYPFWPDIRSDQFDNQNPVVADLESIVLPWTSPVVLAKKENSGSGIEELATTTDFATTAPAEGLKLDPQSAGNAMLAGHKEKLPLIAMIDGPIESYFSSGKNNPPKGRSATQSSLPSARIFVVGSSHWISDQLLSNFPANAALFENALDAFAMGDELIGIRSREKTSRPIAIMSDGARTAIKYLNVAAGPIAVLAIGGVFFLLRRKKMRKARNLFGGFSAESRIQNPESRL